MISIRASLITGTLIALTLIMVVAGTALYFGVRGILYRQFDDTIGDKARLLASTVELTEKGVEFDLEEQDGKTKDLNGGDTDYFQLSADGTQILYQSHTLGNAALPRMDAKTDHVSVIPFRIRGEIPVRVFIMCFKPRLDMENEDPSELLKNRTEDLEPPVLELAIARETKSVSLFLARLRSLLIAIGLLAVLFTSGLVSAVIRKGLRPLDSAAHQISEIGDDVSRRIELPGVPEELSGIATRLNDLLSRLEAAVTREKSFSADIAHELRTPLAGLRSAIEIASSRPRQAGEYREVLGEMYDIVLRMQSMLQRLLYLCRLDSGELTMEEVPVDLGELVKTSWTSIGSSAADKPLDVQWHQQDDVTVLTDPMLLDIAIRNILENAVSYADSGGTVQIDVKELEESAVIVVTNTGSAVSQEQVPHLLERFTR